MPLDESEIVVLRRLKEQLWVAETRFNRLHMETIFAPDLYEAGRSCKVWSREQLLAHEMQVTGAQLPLLDFEVRAQSMNVAHVTYASIGVDDGATDYGFRSSLRAHAEKAERWKRHFGHRAPLGKSAR